VRKLSNGQRVVIVTTPRRTNSQFPPITFFPDLTDYQDNGDGTFSVLIVWTLKDGNQYLYRMGSYDQPTAQLLLSLLNGFPVIAGFSLLGGWQYNYNLRAETVEKLLL
jgi:hypothetical protein